MKGDEGRAFGSAGALESGVEDEGRGTSGPRGMNQAEQTLNFEIRYRRTKATHHWRPNWGTHEVHLGRLQSSTRP